MITDDKRRGVASSALKLSFWGLVVALFILSVTASIVRYLDFIRNNPVEFAVECIAFSLLSSLPVFFMARNRGVESEVATVFIFLLMAAKIAALYVVVEISGINSLVFGR